ncbi:hypothetical protein [Rufibacter soli]
MMRKIAITIAFVFAGFLLYLYLTDKGVDNYQRFKRLKVGMKKEQALQVMGNPDFILEDTKQNRTGYFYTRPRYYLSDDMKVIIDNKADTVIHLVKPE